VSVWKHESLSLTITIAPDGKINYPLAGEIESSGLTLVELQERIATGLREHLRNPQVSVTLQDAQSYRVFVLGEVMQPGKQILDGETSLIQSIAMAGGFTPFAETENIVVYRPSADANDRIKFDYKRFIEHDPEMPDIMLRPGDTIIVN
jgi:polysaccharide export outer membrane protein